MLSRPKAFQNPLETLEQTTRSHDVPGETSILTPFRGELFKRLVLLHDEIHKPRHAHLQVRIQVPLAQLSYHILKDLRICALHLHLSSTLSPGAEPPIPPGVQDLLEPHQLLLVALDALLLPLHILLGHLQVQHRRQPLVPYQPLEDLLVQRAARLHVVAQLGAPPGVHGDQIRLLHAAQAGLISTEAVPEHHVVGHAAAWKAKPACI